MQMDPDPIRACYQDDLFVFNFCRSTLGCAADDVDEDTAAVNDDFAHAKGFTL